MIHKLDGAALGDMFGYSANGVGDVDGDGVPDLAVGAISSDATGQNSGSVSVYSGHDGHVIHTFAGEASGNGFGAAVSRAGDVDRDGHADILIGAPFKFAGSKGRVYVFSGKNGTPLYKFDGEASDDRFGWAVAGGVDVDGDDVADLAIGAPGADPNGGQSGRVGVSIPFL